MGTTSGVQRYLCHSCGHSFRNKRRPLNLRATLWHDYVFNRHTVKQLSSKYNRSSSWVRKELRSYEPPPPSIAPRKMIAVMDCTFFGRTRGYLVVRDHHQKENVYWLEIERETREEYQCARDTLESEGFVIQAVVADGKPGIKGVYEDLPVQMCHFHQKAIITRYLTMRPKLLAGIELRELVHGLRNADEESFTLELEAWHKKWSEFLNERTVNPETNRRPFTHRRLRSAYRSLKTNLPYLFTYRKYPELCIPNTTNGLEGSFSHLKDLVRVHRGLKRDLKHKIIESILQNRHRKSNYAQIFNTCVFVAAIHTHLLWTICRSLQIPGVDSRVKLALRDSHRKTQSRFLPEILNLVQEGILLLAGEFPKPTGSPSG